MNLTIACYDVGMEIINVKVPEGTKSKLRQINPNISSLIREQIDRLLEAPAKGSVHQRASHLCGVIKGGPTNVARSREYLKLIILWTLLTRAWW